MVGGGAEVEEEGEGSCSNNNNNNSKRKSFSKLLVSLYMFSRCICFLFRDGTGEGYQTGKNNHFSFKERDSGLGYLI